MSPQRWLGVGAVLVLVSFVRFAFRQSMKVKPDDRPDRGDGAGSDGNL